VLSKVLFQGSVPALSILVGTHVNKWWKSSTGMSHEGQHAGYLTGSYLDTWICGLTFMDQLQIVAQRSLLRY
jgi:hypothetical protein